MTKFFRHDFSDLFTSQGTAYERLTGSSRGRNGRTGKWHWDRFFSWPYHSTATEYSLVARGGSTEGPLCLPQNPHGLTRVRTRASKTKLVHSPSLSWCHIRINGQIHASPFFILPYFKDRRAETIRAILCVFLKRLSKLLCSGFFLFTNRYEVTNP